MHQYFYNNVTEKFNGGSFIHYLSVQVLTLVEFKNVLLVPLRS